MDRCAAVVRALDVRPDMDRHDAVPCSRGGVDGLRVQKVDETWLVEALPRVRLLAADAITPHAL